MKPATQHRIQLGKRVVDYRLIRSKDARKLRVRVGPSGVEVLLPAARKAEDISAFLNRNERWLFSQLQRIDSLRGLLASGPRRAGGEILYRGARTKVRVETIQTRARTNLVHFGDGEIVIRRGPASRVDLARSLEYWLRRQARIEVHKHLAGLEPRLRQRPNRVYIMGQRTKWGNCSAERNLSFNWRLILAPQFVLHYLVTHEAVHLAVPDHSAKFWLAVQSLCPETERAKQWLSSNGTELNCGFLQHLGG